MNKVKLKNIAQVVAGQSPKSIYYNTEMKGLPFLQGNRTFGNLFPYIDTWTTKVTKKAKKGDVLISVRAPVGDLNLCETDLCIGRGLAAISSEKYPNRFIYYSLKYNINSLISSSTGTTFSSINKNDLESLDLIIPEENQISNVTNLLSALDDKIELNNTINAELEAMAKTLYDYWFVQFEFPNAEGKPYKTSGGAMEFNPILKREIPKGWEVSVFNDWIKQTKTGDWGKDEIEGNYTERVFCVRGADINGLNGKGEVKAPERFILKNNLSKKLEPNDFIIEISGGSPTQSTARIALLTKESFDRFDTDVVCSNFCKAVTLKDEIYAFNFQQEWQRLYDAGVFFGFEGKTSGIKNFLFDSFMESYHIVKPPKDLAKKYNLFTTELERKRQLNLKQNQVLSQLRDWLLPMLMNGQVKVVDAEEQAMSIAAEPNITYAKRSEKNKDDSKEERFRLWLSNEKLAARGDVDEVVLREIFDAMDDEDQ